MRHLLLLVLLAPQESDLRSAYDRWQVAKQEYVKAFEVARKEGKVGKGTLPENVQKLRDAADVLRDAFLKDYGKLEKMTAGEADLVGRAWEDARDYTRASDCYELAVKGMKPEDDEYRQTLYKLSLAALNSKNSERAAKWMKTLIDAEKDLPKGKRAGDFVRTILYPRQLVELRRFEDLLAFGEELAKDGDDAEARKGAVLAKFLGSMGLKKYDAAEAVIDGVLAKPEAGQHAWGIQAKVAFLAGRGKHADAEKLMADYLKIEVTKETPPIEVNTRKYVEAAAALIGKPAPEVVVDRWVGAEKDPGAKPLEAWKGKVVLLDFWQPW